jgi:hypothetical protein
MDLTPNNRDQNEFNMAFAYLARLNVLYYEADKSAAALEAYMWYQTLTILYRELSTEMKPDERKDIREKYITGIRQQVFQNAAKNQRQGKNTIDPALWDELHDFEMELRRITKDSGLQNKMKSDPRFAI